MQIFSLLQMPRPRILYPKHYTEASELMAEKGLMLSETVSEPMICTNGLSEDGATQSFSVM